jgi:hypothetical protein
MKKWVVLIVLLFSTVVFANPVGFDPFKTIGSFFVFGSLLWLETSIITVILFFCHMELVTSFIALFIGNLIIYFAIFLPALSAIDNLLTAEAIIVAVEGIFIKIISRINSFQTEDFKGLKWWTAFIIAAIGNALSYYVGTVITR